MTLPADYVERVYAGVLGKLIGVYLGRPIEGWPHERIVELVGEVDHYLHAERNVPLVVTDDDVSGTFIFLRAMPDRGNDPNLTPAQIGETWLNYLIEKRTILWWGGIGNSTEHTAYLRLKHGVPAPLSGSIALNGKTIAEQIGAQIFIDGWGMICPADPERAADFARRAASVSHDGEAILGAQVIAAMEAQAFVEPDLNRLLDTALGLIPADSTIARVIHDVREWHAADPADWRRSRERIAGRYGYDKFGGACHMVPNHALVIHALLHGDDDFSASQMIVNTCGWDTDCNAANVGCLMGIKNGVAGIDRTTTGYDWRGPVADRLYLATADGGQAISDAVREAYTVVNIARDLAGEPPLAPKDGARFHFEAPGSLQGFRAEGSGTLANASGASRAGTRTLALAFDGDARAVTPTFIPEEAIAMRGYTLLASPTLYPGQELRAAFVGDPGNAGDVGVRPVIRWYGPDDTLRTLAGPAVALAPGMADEVLWTIPDLGGCPVAEAGFEATAPGAATVHLDALDWSGTPTVALRRPDGAPGPARFDWDSPAPAMLWRRAWVDGVDQWEFRWPQTYRIVQNEGTGLISQGTADWRDARAEATIELPLAKEGGLALRVGGLRRWYALLLGADGTARLVKSADGRTTLAEAPFTTVPETPYRLALEVVGSTLRGSVDDALVLEATDDDAPLTGGGVALVVTEGCLISDEVRVVPAG